jgi:hypothetical protein
MFFTAHNRTVYALASIGLGYGLRHSHASFRHILPAPVFAYAKPLSGPAIRIKQPER